MYISNLTNKNSIIVDSAFVMNNQTADIKPYVWGMTENDLLFVKISFFGLNPTQKISKALFNVYCEKAYYSTSAKLIRCNQTNLSPSEMISFAQSLTGDEEVIDKIQSYGTANSANLGDGNCVLTFDITKLVRGLSNASSIEFAVRFSSVSNSELIVHSPVKSREDKEVCIITASEVNGLCSMYEYDEHNLGQAGRVSINLYNGKPIYSSNLVSSLSKKIPINFSLFQNFTNTDEISHFKNKVIPNFHYRIYNYDEEYVIEDPSGFQNCYRKISSSYSVQKLKEKYGIKHKLNGYDLYFSSFDFSYFYLIESNGVKTIQLYNQQDTLTLFDVDETSAKIKKVTTSLDYTLTYDWNGNRLQSISNNDGDIMYVEYVEPGYISKVSFPNMNRFISFTETDSSLEVQVYYEKTTNGTTTTDVINHLKLIFSSNQLTHVYNKIDGKYLHLTYDSSNRVESAGVYTQIGLVKDYKTSYNYSYNFTKTSDLEGNELFYHFDMYGRVKTIMDKYARTVTYNYAEVEEGISGNKLSTSKVQTNSRNLLDNASFENEEVYDDGSTAWECMTMNGSAEVVNCGALSHKCLKIASDASDTVAVVQNVINPTVGSYSLSGFIKHPVLTELNNDNLEIKVYGTYLVNETVITKVNSTTTETKIVPVTRSYGSKATLDFTKTDWYHFKTGKVTIPTDATNITMSVKIIISYVDSVVYIDDLQLTDAKFSTRHNLIENGYMEFFDSNNRPIGWNFENLEPEDHIVTSSFYQNFDVYHNILGDYAMRIAPGNSLYNGSTNTYKLKKMYKTINIHGLAGEQFVYSVLGCADVTENVIFRTYITFTYENKDEKTYQFDFDKNFSNWQMLTRDITTEDNYSKVVVGVEYDGGVEVCFDCFQLYKDSFGKYYKYDNLGKLIETVSEGGISSKIIYNDDNQVEEVYSTDGSYLKYTYEDGLLISARDLYGNLVEFEYDNENRIIKQTITSKNETFQTSTVYDDVNNTETSIDEFGKSSIVALDYLKRVSRYTSPLSQNIDYTYNNKLQLTRIKSVLNSTTYRNDFTYNITGNTSKIVSYGGNEYTLVYDALNRITSVKCNSNVYESYEFDPFVEGYSKGNLIKKTVDGTGDYYEFEYNDEGEVVKYKLNGSVLATYIYDDTGNLYELCDVKNGITYHYEYDLKGKLLKEIATTGNSTSYSYDNLGNIQKKTYNINNLVRSIDYEYDYETNEYSKEGYFRRIAGAYGDELIIGDKEQFGAKKFYQKYDKTIDSETKLEVVRFYDYDSKIKYILSEVNKYRNNNNQWKRNFYYNKTFYAWVKPKAYITNQEYYKTNLLSFSKIVETSSGNIQSENILSYLAISETGNLIYYSANSNPTIISGGKIEFNKWNLVGIQFTKPTESQTSKARIILNGVLSDLVDINEKVNEIGLLTLGNNDNLPQLAAHLHTTLYFALTTIGAYSYNNDDFSVIYSEGKKYLSDYDISRINGTSYYNEYVYSDFDVITLNGSLESSKGYMPAKIAEIDSSYHFEKNKIFKFDNDIKRFVYASLIENSALKKGNTAILAYDFSLKNEGTISLRFKYQTANTEKCIMSSMWRLNEKLGIYITSDGKFKLVINNYSIQTDKSAPVNVWNHLLIRYKFGTIQIYCNCIEIYNDTISVDFYSSSIFYFGNNASANKQLNGYLEMIAYCDTFATDSDKNNLFINGSITSVRNRLDALGRLSEKIITVNDEEFVTSYTYNKTRVTTQTLPNDDTISYTYNDVGQVTSKRYTSGTSSSIVNYVYDKLGRLIEESEGSTIRKYTYGVGMDLVNYKTYTNSVKNKDIQYSYSNNKLSLVCDNMTGKVLQETDFSASNAGFYPLKFVLGNEKLNLTWEGKRLTKIGNNIIYTYDSQGIRIKKQTPLETTTYVLEGNNVISMNKIANGQTYRLDFVYDVNNQLIGLNTQEGHYFYIKDITGNILGLIDSQGDFIVKYTYNAWGELLDKEIIQSCIASVHNPFIYKGYYYDEETNLFLVTSRYYSPELGRFIQPADVSSLNPSSINGLNLYSYANNNPIGIAYSSSGVSGTTGSGMVHSIGNTHNFISNNIPESEGRISLPEVPWLVENSTTMYGAVSSLISGTPILAHYFKYASIINDEFKLYGISKWKTSLQLSNVNLKMGALDGALIGVNVLIDMYDSYQRGVSTEGILLGGTLTAASSIVMLYLNKGIMWSTTAIGTAICPGLGTAIGFTVGLGISLFVDWKLGELISDWIDSITS